MRYQLIIEKRVLKEINSLPKPDALRISKAINSLTVEPRPYGCLKLESELDLYRIRIGDYRVVYSIEDHQLIVIVIKVSHRKDVYRK